MEYLFPEKDLLEKNSNEIKNEKRYYNLSKLIYKTHKDHKLLFPIGIDNSNDKYYMDLTDKSSLLISGETGSGKSIFLNSLIISLLMKNNPDELKLLLIDSSKVELNLYNGIPHLLKNVLFDSDETINALNMILDIIEKRKKLFNKLNVKNIIEYNNKSENKMPQIIIVIDEAINILSKNESPIIISKIILAGCRFGIHLVLSTSAYLKEFVTTNLLNRFENILTFDLASAEQADYIKLKNSNLLTIYGEALVKSRNRKIKNLQTPYVSTNDINSVVNFIKKHY